MILITGATGNVGSELVNQLDKQGLSLRVVTRDLRKVAKLNERIERVEGELSDPEVARRAVAGVQSIFLFPVVTESDHKSVATLLKAAKEAGVQHVVMLSSLGAQAPKGTNKIGELHREKELLVEQSGIPWTFLRPGAFMSNSFQWLPTIKEQGKVFNPTGDGKLAPISPKDIAAAAAVALLRPELMGEIRTLTGPELLDAKQQVEILSRVLGQKLECVDVEPGVVASQFKSTGAPAFLADGLSQMWATVKEGKVALQTKDLEQLTGNKGQKFEAWCKEHAQDFLN
ncbi:MAG TPA: SDR family oxidoreductase [Planktothrix sp.]|jgi:uncharacterized protein YbjT (DUF2867 family)